jgi:hypothetical protein
MTATVCALGAALVLSAGVAQPRPIAVGSFELAGSWSLGLGNEFPGAQGQYELDKHEPHSGAACAKLVGDFSHGGAYVAIIRGIDPPLAMTKVTFWARSADAGTVVVRLVDGTSQMHQGNVTFPTDGKWHKLEVGVPQGWGHWSGANDGVFHQPLTQIWLDLDRGTTKSGKGGTIWFDDVVVEASGADTEGQFDLRAGRMTLNDLEITAKPVNPEWGVWLLQVSAQNRGKKAVAATVEAEPLYVAPWATTLYERSGARTIGAGKTEEVVLRLPPPKSRHLSNETRVTVRAGDAAGSMTVAMAGRQAPASPPGTPRAAIELPRNPLGVVVHLGEPNERLLRAVADAGLRWVRTDFIWAAFEPERGKLQCPESIDKMVDQGRKMGLEWMCILNGDNAKCYPDDPYNEEAYARFAAFVAEHFKRRITFFEILNEPLGQMGKYGYWQKYDGLVNAAAAAIKKVRPDAFVAPNTAYPHDTFTFIPRLSEAVDGVTLHPYPYQTIPEMGDVSSDPPYEKKDGTFRSEIECVREWLAAAKCGKRIALTEFGWPTYWPQGKLMTYEAVTAEAQAKYLPRRMIEAMAMGCDPVISYDIWDDFDNPSHPEAHFGIVDLAGNRKPAWWSVARLCSLLGDAKPWQPDFAVKPSFAMEGRTLRDMARDVDAGVKNMMDAFKMTDRAAALRYILPPADVRMYWFRGADGAPMLALWQAVKVEGLDPFLGDVELGTAAYGEAVATELYTGRSWPVSVERRGETAVLRDVPAADGPIIVKLHK